MFHERASITLFPSPLLYRNQGKHLLTWNG